MFKPVPTNVSFPKLERQVGRLWKDRRVYERSLAQRRDAQRFDLSERVEDLFGNPVAEILVLGIAAEVREGQHDNGAITRGRRRGVGTR